MVMFSKLNRINDSKKNILVTAIGSFAADIVIKNLKRKGYNVIGCDIYPKEWIADAYNVDKFYQAINAKNKNAYISFLLSICDREKIKFIIPLTDPEVDILALEKKQFEKHGIVLCISDVKTIQLCRNKYALHNYLLEYGIKNIIPTKLLDQEFNFDPPFIIKPISGRSSEELRIVQNIDEYLFLKRTLVPDKYILQPFIKGNIITVDLVRESKTNIVVCVARRELLRTRAGAGTTVEIIENKGIEDLCIKIAEKVDIIGAVNFEFIETKNEKYVLLEINPRFSAGVEFTYLAGYDVVNNHLNVFMNKKINSKGLIKKMIIARKYEEYITKYL